MSHLEAEAEAENANATANADEQTEGDDEDQVDLGDETEEEEDDDASPFPHVEIMSSNLHARTLKSSRNPLLDLWTSGECARPSPRVSLFRVSLHSQAPGVRPPANRVLSTSQATPIRGPECTF